jgi:broad specificity phosphatase PhoE
MTADLILIRHAEVSSCYRGRCYGCSDVELSERGEQRSHELSKLLSTQPIARVVHSGLQRTRYLAERLAEQVQQPAECCLALQERDYGRWELEHWDVLYQQFGDEMLRTVSDPQTYRPGGGETTFEMRDRVLEWFQSLQTDGLIVAVTHGGPIAALRGTLGELPVADWLPLIPACGEFVAVQFVRYSQVGRIVNPPNNGGLSIRQKAAD